MLHVSADMVGVTIGQAEGLSIVLADNQCQFIICRQLDQFFVKTVVVSIQVTVFGFNVIRYAGVDFQQLFGKVRITKGFCHIF